MNSTDCRKCVFSTWSDVNTHVGCELDLLSIFVQKGKVKEIDFLDLKYKSIQGAICPKFRNGLWLEQYKDSWQERLDFECRLSYEVYILANENTTTSDIEVTANSIILQSPIPVGVNVVNFFAQIPSKEFLDSLYRYELPHPLVHTILDDTYKVGDAIDFAIKNTKGNYILITKAGSKLPSGFVEYAQTSIYKNMDMVALLMLDEENFLIDKNLYNLEKYNLMEDIINKYPEYAFKWQNVV
jgi:hypothetical protein